jgi:hypothetical protein
MQNLTGLAIYELVKVDCVEPDFEPETAKGPEEGLVSGAGPRGLSP